MAVSSITPAEFVALKAATPVTTPILLLDVRSPEEFQEVHADGATLMPLDRLDPNELHLRTGAMPDQAIYVICKSGMRSETAQGKLRNAGYSNVICIAGGTAAWQKAKLPVVHGAVQKMSIERQVRIAAGAIVLAGLILDHFIHPVGFLIAGVIATGLIFAGVTDTCGMGIVLMKCPWNKTSAK